MRVRNRHPYLNLTYFVHLYCHRSALVQLALVRIRKIIGVARVDVIHKVPFLRNVLPETRLARTIC